MKKKFAFAPVITVFLVVILALLLTSCGGGGTQGPTEQQVVAEKCLLGNQAACVYFNAMVNLKNAQETAISAKAAYEASLQVTPTPVPTSTSTVTP